jgi:hypothetical protein
MSSPAETSMLRIHPTVVVAGRITACAVVAVLLTGAAIGSAGPQSAAGRPRRAQPTSMVSGSPGSPVTTTGATFQLTSGRHYGQPANASGYSVIVRTGPASAWLLGGSNPGGPSTPVAAQWNGAQLTTAALPSGLTSFVSDASATSMNDVWAVSQYGRYLLHYDGVQWRLVKRWQTGQVTGLTAITPSDVWVFGTTADGTSDVGTWHWDGYDWLRMYGLAGTVVRASATSDSDIWAIAASSASYSILYYDGTSWQPVPTGSDLDGVQPRDILALSPSDVWVLGTQADTAGGPRLVLLHWNGIGWTSLVTQINAWAGRLAAGANGTVLVTATPADASATGQILQVAAPGGWPVITAESSLADGSVSDVVLAGGTQSLWASGAILTRLGGEAVIWTGQLGQALSQSGVGT